MVVSSYRNSFFNTKDYQVKHNTLIATARAGNVIGGGDWSDDRLIPDLIRSAIKGEYAKIRSPYATRPWQHVLEPIHGYLMIGQALLSGKIDFGSSWNFGPYIENTLSVRQVLELSKTIWEDINFEIKKEGNEPYEAKLLSLNINKSLLHLGWKPKWTNEESISKTIGWYKEFAKSGQLNTEEDLKFFYGIN
jgi:CDP-glucose 4,6-dehydratase